MRVYLIRHGKVDNGDGTRWIGHRDIDLTAHGRDQAARVAEAFEGIPLRAVLTSQLLRSRRTAEPLVRAVGLSAEVDPRWAELDFGSWEGRPVAEVETENPGIHDAFRLGRDDFAPPGGESLGDLRRRVTEAFASVVSAGEGPVAVVTHGGPIRMVLRQLLAGGNGAPPPALHFRISFASVTAVDCFPEGVSLSVWNDTSHLRGKVRVAWDG